MLQLCGEFGAAFRLDNKVPLPNLKEKAFGRQGACIRLNVSVDPACQGAERGWCPDR